MGMMIDEAITHIMDVICENNTIKHSDLVVFSDEKQALRTAIDTMRKYQKIVDIVSLDGEEFKQCGLKELKEVLEVIADGTINSSDCV